MATDEEIRQVLVELAAWGSANDATEMDRARKMLNLVPEAAALVRILALARVARRILEIGTSNGYSTIWLAWAARETGGRVVSLDRDPSKHEMAASNLRRVGLHGFVELWTGDATALVEEVPGPWDLVFFDADRRSAPAQLALLLPRLAQGALLLADNVLSHPGEIAGYLAAVAAIPGIDHVVVPIGKGLSVARVP